MTTEREIVALPREPFRARSTTGETPYAEAPLSYGQQRLWFMEQQQPNNEVFTIRTALRLTGPVHVSALEQSLAVIVSRHAVLRTSLPATGGHAVQRIAPTLAMPLPVVPIDVRPEARARMVDRLMADEATRPFDLASGPLIRASLFQFDPADHLFLVTVHHCVFDAWSQAVFLRELSVCYAAFLRGVRPSLPALPLQYGDYAARQMSSRDDLDEQLVFWTKQLDGVPPVADVPADYPAPLVADLRGGHDTIRLSRTLTSAIDELGRRCRATPFMIMLAALTTLLSRLNGVEDVLVASPVAGRTDVELEGLIGFFVETLVFRVDLSGDPTFRTLLTRVRGVTLDAFDHQRLPFQDLVHALRVERFANRNPLCDVMLNVLNTPDLAPDLPGLSVELVRWADRGSEHALSLFVWREAEQQLIRCHYQLARFSAERIARILQQLEFLLEQVVAAPDRVLRTYSLIPPATSSLLPDPSAALPEPTFESVVSMFRARAVAGPAAPAVAQGPRVWTYGDLAGSVLAIVRALAASGHRPQDVVAVVGGPSFGLVAAVVATMASRGILLTIDPDLPAERKRLMLAETGAAFLLACDAAGHEDVMAWASCRVIRIDPAAGQRIDDDGGSTGLHGDQVPSTLQEPGPDDPAYIVFTSGGTGSPRAVLGSHKGLAHFVAWERVQLGVTPDDRCAQLTSLSFDVVLRDVFLPLTSGAVVCLPGSPKPTGGSVLEWLDRERVTLLHSGPTLAAAWLERWTPGVSLRRLRYLVLSGEPLTDRLVRRWREAFPDAGAIVNLYGATEATLAQSFYVVPDQPLPGVQPVGLPLPDTQLLVLSADRRLCGVGERGEVAVRTPFRTFGYLNDRNETTSRFPRNPFRVSASDLLYLTGDVGRYRPDGTLEILGRLDDQIKIRGVRVEPQEVNFHLLEHPSVAQSHVGTGKGPGDDPLLAAYVVPRGDLAPTSSELRTFLHRRLPSAMVPSAFVILPSLPLLPTGKIDRRALPAPPPAIGPDSVSPARPGAQAGNDQTPAGPNLPPVPLTDEERHQLLVEWNETARRYSGPACLHELFEAQVERTPSAAAVISDEETISYGRLNARANQLAHLLRARGVGRDVPVGVCLERSIDLVVAVIGIVKAGGAYVPLDPSYPIERLRFMMREAGAPVVVTTGALAARLEAVSAFRTDADGEALDSQSTHNLSTLSTPDSLAYVIFTSGSTGRPKGVAVPHEAIVNHLRWTSDALPLGADDRVLQRTPFTFDVSVWELWAPLVAGAGLVLAPVALRFQPAAIVDTVAQHGVTTLHIVPSLLERLLDEPGLSRCATLRRVCCAGEQLSARLQERFFGRLDASLHNLYGPTECCIYATAWTCRRGGGEGPVPIGRPISNTQVYVLDAELQPVPVGVDGELYLGGLCLARGYINQPELTAERFIRHPFSDRRSERLYRTGDRVRYRADGDLEFLGRLDDQIKLYGVRIEPGEVEAALCRHPRVKAAVVVAREDTPDVRRLVAYMVASSLPTLGSIELRRFLAAELPPSMVPSSFVWLDALPVTATGKLDRRGLPAPASRRPDLPNAFVPPRTAVEEALAGIWSEILHVEPIGVDDDFFDLGGHSLLATQVISRVNEGFGRNLPLRRLFEEPTIAELGRSLEGGKTG
jgi:amino acid adenylation domain-containing protein